MVIILAFFVIFLFNITISPIIKSKIEDTIENSCPPVSEEKLGSGAGPYTDGCEISIIVFSLLGSGAGPYTVVSSIAKIFDCAPSMKEQIIPNVLLTSFFIIITFLSHIINDLNIKILFLKVIFIY